MNYMQALATPPAERSISVVLVDDHAMVRKGVELLLRSQGFAVIGVADGVTDAAAIIARRRPDVALVDVALADGSGVALADELAEIAPGTAVLLYTGLGTPEITAAVLGPHTRGIALKAGPPAELAAAICTVAAGGVYIDQRLEPLISSAALERRDHTLTPREREILAMLARGMTGAQVAAELVLAPETVRTHVRNAMTKLHAKTRVHALALAVQREEIEL